jgi:hypothetical protein
MGVGEIHIYLQNTGITVQVGRGQLTEKKTSPPPLKAQDKTAFYTWDRSIQSRR